MCSEGRFIGKAGGHPASIAESLGERLFGAAMHWRKGMPAGPPALAKRVQIWMVDARLIEYKAVGGQPIEVRRGDPGIAVATQKPGVQPIDNEHDDVHSLIGELLDIQGANCMFAGK